MNVSMLADGKTAYKVKRSDITAVDEFGHNYAPMPADQMASRIERAFRRDKPELYDDMKAREMPDEVTVSDKLTQSFVYFDLEPSKTDPRKFTMVIPATSVDGNVHKEFRMTVDPFYGAMNPAEKWDSYDGRGITPCGLMAKKAAPAVMKEEGANKAEESAKKAEESAKRAEEAAKKNEKVFEKSLQK